MSETDARGNVTTYEVSDTTSRNEVVTDRLGNKTAYEYDASGRVTRVANTGVDDTAYGTVEYAYDMFDNLTAITRGDGMQYALGYNAFHNLESIGVQGAEDPLVQYAYKNGNGRLKEITYANGDKMTATYNSAGQLVAEKWFDTDGTSIARYKYVYDGDGNIVRTVDFGAGKEYTYIYEEGRVVRAAEYTVTVGENDIITARTLLHTLQYTYNREGDLVRKQFVTADGTEHTVSFEKAEDRTVAHFTAQGKDVVSHSKTDTFGRKTFDELQLGSGFLTRRFAYHDGVVTREHAENGKVKSAPTTQLVSEITFSDGRTIAYEYDAEERITKVTDSVDGVTEYTYDALGQLLTEKVNGDIVNRMTYDSYGNILSKNGVQYTYDEVWRDKLLSVGTESVSYDKQGNPVVYRGRNLEWEKGRQMKWYGANYYTYNANGIRTSKAVCTAQGYHSRHDYVLDGAKILRETWGGNTLLPLYDNEDAVCGIVYDGNAFYFQKNLQGDIIAITNHTGAVVARYSYDAWGVCKVKYDTSGCDIANINPFRYRGYYYDTETGLYYLQSRYYDPEIGRFINADEPTLVAIAQRSAEHGLYTYCHNEPVFNFDYTGFWVISIGISNSFIAGIGINCFVNLLLDSTGDYGIFIGTSLLFGFSVSPSRSYSVGWFWGFKKIKNYLNSVTVSFSVSYGTVVYSYYKYPLSNKKMVGIQISNDNSTFVRETAPIDGGLYFPLKKSLSKMLKNAGHNLFQLQKAIRKIKIQIRKG
ncbi:MAG: RHS repeat-associated core domain-containing protein [Ruminococcaceae bacterium]|nr:RHS repeat-associated core domain-containing protein [Oscillospiraceae bacterium]